MAEYIERSKANDVLINITALEGSELEEAVNAICAIPAADVVPVVRCKDCKHSYEDLCGRVCSYGVAVDCVVPDDFFCADGAKMDGGGE